MGWIKKDKSGYQAIQLYDIFSDFHSKTGLFFAKNDILKSDDYNFHNILSKIEQLIIVDNVVRPQQYMIDKKAIKKKDSMRPARTVCASSGKVDLTSIKAIPPIHDKIRTSARHSGAIIGVSPGKANKILNKKDFFSRRQTTFKFEGISEENIQRRRIQFPFSTIYISKKHKAVMVALGSTLKLNNPFKSSLVLPYYANMVIKTI
jgi:hypothetical protein